MRTLANNTIHTPSGEAEQQAHWETAYDSAKDELLYFGDFTDKGGHVRLLQRVKVVRRTPKQIYVIAAYTLYRPAVEETNIYLPWSMSPDGGVFGNLYNTWIPVTRYRLRRIHKARLFSLDMLTTSHEDVLGETKMHCWKQLCNACLFNNEDEYAKWHLARFENMRSNQEVPSAYEGNIIEWARNNLKMPHY